MTETFAGQLLTALVLFALLAFFCAHAVGDVAACPVTMDPDRSGALVTEHVRKRAEALAEAQRLRELRRRFRAWRERRRLALPRRVHEWALHELRLGVREVGANIVPRYKVWGWPWCGEAVRFCVERAERGRPLPANPASTSSWRTAIRNSARGLRPVWERRNVRPGDVVCFAWGHVGIVHRTTGAGFWSIEGNSSDAVRLRWHAWGEADTFGRVLPTRRVPPRFAEVAP